MDPNHDGVGGGVDGLAANADDEFAAALVLQEQLGGTKLAW